MKKLLLMLLTLVCVGCFAGAGISAFAADDVTYEKIAGIEGHITVSSELNGDPNSAWELSKLANPSRGIWTAGWKWTSNPSCDEWVRIDLTEPKTIGKITVHNEARNCYARKFVVYGSLDGTSLFELARYSGGDEGYVGDEPAVELEFPAASVRYVIISIREKGLNGANYLVGMSNIEIYETSARPTEYHGYTKLPATVSVDEALTGSAEVLTDGEAELASPDGAFWTGGLKHDAETDTDEIVFDAGAVENIGGIRLFPRVATTNSAVACTVYGFPKEFTVYRSDDGDVYTPVPGAVYTDYTPELSWNEFFFERPVKARFIKVLVTKRGISGSDYLTQLTEAELYRADFEAVSEYTKVEPETVTSSGAWTDDWKDANAFDGSPATGWVASWGYAEHKYADEWIKADFGTNKLLGKIILRVGQDNVPAAFEVLVSEDDENWATIVKEDDAHYEGNAYEKTFDSVSARYVKVVMYVKGVNGAYYLGGFTEIECYQTADETAMGSLLYYGETPYTSAEASSVYGTFGTDKLSDGITANKTASLQYFMSEISADPTVDAADTAVGFDGLYVAFDAVENVDAVWLFPRFDGVPGSCFGFPRAFDILYSVNGLEWYKAASYTDYEVRPGWNKFVLPGRVSAKYIGISVGERGKDGDLYAIEFTELKVMHATAERSVVTGALVLDKSSITVSSYTAPEFVYTYEEFRLNLADYFHYDLPGTLVYTLDGNGEIAEENGAYAYIVTPETAGEFTVTITAHPEGKAAKTGTLTFTLNAISKADPDVIARRFTPELAYCEGVTLRVNLGALFVYEGEEALVYSTDKGEIIEENGAYYLVYKVEAGVNEITVSAYPEGKEDKKADNVITFEGEARPEPSPEQPPVYGPSSGGCASSLGGTTFTAFAALAVAACIRRKRK